MRTTIQHIADELNLTPATGSRALSDHPRISTVQIGREAFNLLLQLIQNNTIKYSIKDYPGTNTLLQRIFFAKQVGWFRSN